MTTSLAAGSKSSQGRRDDRRHRSGQSANRCRHRLAGAGPNRIRVAQRLHVGHEIHRTGRESGCSCNRSQSDSCFGPHRADDDPAPEWTWLRLVVDDQGHRYNAIQREHAPGAWQRLPCRVGGQRRRGRARYRADFQPWKLRSDRRPGCRVDRGHGRQHVGEHMRHRVWISLVIATMALGALLTQAIDASGAATPIQFSGDLDGSYVSQTVVGVQGHPVPAPTVGNTLSWNGTSWLPRALDLSGGSGYVVNTLPAANQAAQTMTGDVTGTTAANTVTQAQGGAVTFTSGTTPVIQSSSTATSLTLGTNT